MNAPRFDAEWTNAIYLFVTRDFRQHLDEVAKDHADTVAKVHAEGWKQTASAIRDGLTAIARAIDNRR